MIDLHTHSTHSDGTTTVQRNVALARERGLSGIAITDHDTLAGWEEGTAACRRAGIEMVPGVELSCEVDGHSVHILGYWVDPDDERLVTECARLRTERRRRAAAIVERLAELGAAVELSDVLVHAGSAPVGRPHVAAALVRAGHVPDVDTAFAELLQDGGPAWVPKRALDPAEGVLLLRSAGGAAVLAHPGLSPPVTPELVDRLVEAGLGGVEAEHAGHDDAARTRWRQIAAARGLVVTGSSDFHGIRKSLHIGDAATPRRDVERLRVDYASP